MYLRRPLAVVLTLASLLSICATARGTTQAHDTGTPFAAGQESPRAAHIHNGTCQTPGSTAWSLDDAAAPGSPATASPAIVTPSVPLITDVGPVLAESITVVRVHLADLERTSFAIDVHDGDGDDHAVVLCGDVTGTITDDALTMPLGGAAGSGLTGVALLEDDGTGSTTVTIQVLRAGADGASTPTAATASAPTLDLADISFKPSQLTIPANTDVVVTLSNIGVLPHNFSVSDHNNANVKNLAISVDVAPGETKAVTINAPAGDYYIFCGVPGHEAAGMFGVLHAQ